MLRPDGESEDLFCSEAQNPLYQALENQLRLEFEWAYNEKNLYSVAWILLHKKETKGGDWAKMDEIVQSDLRRIGERNLSSSISTEFILGLCFAASAIHRKRGAIPGGLSNAVRQLLEEARQRGWLGSQEFLSLILYSLSGISEFDQIIASGTIELRERCNQFSVQLNREGFVDCLFGLVAARVSHDIESPFLANVLLETSTLSDEAIAKLCIVLYREGHKERALGLVTELEERLAKRFAGSLGQSLERGLREVAGLVNSSCPPETVSAILEEKREKGQGWAKDLEARDGEIIIRRIPRLGEVPRVDPKLHALALEVLTLYNRSVIVTLDVESFRKLREAYLVNRGDYVDVRRNEYWLVLVLCALASFVVLSLPEAVVGIFSLGWEGLMTFVAKVGADWTGLLMLTPWGMRLLLWVWLVRILYSLRKGGQITISEVLKKVPILGDIVLVRLLGEA